MLVECVVNLSEGRDTQRLRQLDAAAGLPLLDRHSDAAHHRSVFTLVGAPAQVEVAARSLARAAVELLDLRPHAGAHPRLGVLDVVPFVPYAVGAVPVTDLTAVLGLRDEFAHWLATELAVPSFLYGPVAGGAERTLPEVRRRAFDDLAPDFGPAQPHPSAGASAVGARPVLIAYNVWVSALGVARQVAAEVRGAAVRALGLDLGDRAQVSCNLIEPARVGPLELYDAVTALVQAAGGQVLGAELVGLVPAVVLDAVPRRRWVELGLSADSSVESRLPPQAAGTDAP